MPRNLNEILRSWIRLPDVSVLLPPVLPTEVQYLFYSGLFYLDLSALQQPALPLDVSILQRLCWLWTFCSIDCAAPWKICSAIYSSLCCPRTRLFCTVAACAAPERCSTKDCATWTCLYTTEACHVHGGVCMAYSSLCCTRTCLSTRDCASSVRICQRSLCCTLITLQISEY